MINKLPFVSVIIPTYKDWNRVILCLRALQNQSYPDELIEILVINNDSDECEFDAEQLLEIGKNIRLLHESKVGSYAARNKGVESSKGEIFAFTDSDCIPKVDWIINAVILLQTKRVRRVAGLIKIFRPAGGSWLVWKYDEITAFNQKYNASLGVSVTANLVVDRVTFEKVGLFNPLLLSGGDVEWSNRASRLGIEIDYAENVVVNHPSRGSIKELFQKVRRVTGGTYFRRKQQRSVFRFFLWHFLPPLRYIRVLLKGEKKIGEVFYVFWFFWGLKILMAVEVLRLQLGGKPVR